jgi:hypothetical protein
MGVWESLWGGTRAVNPTQLAGLILAFRGKMYSIVEGGKMPLFISNNRLHKGSGCEATSRDFSKPFVISKLLAGIQSYSEVFPEFGPIEFQEVG